MTVTGRALRSLCVQVVSTAGFSQFVAGGVIHSRGCFARLVEVISGRITARCHAMAMPDSGRQGIHFMQHFERTHQTSFWQHDMCLYRPVGGVFPITKFVIFGFGGRKEE
jgi:hypothetical protein